MLQVMFSLFQTEALQSFKEDHLLNPHTEESDETSAEKGTEWECPLRRVHLQRDQQEQVQQQQQQQQANDL